MPVLAHFEDLPDSAERRHWVRKALKLGIAGGAQQVVIHDLSLTGALIETSVPMLVGSAFDIDLPLAGCVQTTVVWNSGEFYGCQFDLPISPAALSAAVLQSDPLADPDANNTPADPAQELNELCAQFEQLVRKIEETVLKLSRKSTD